MTQTTANIIFICKGVSKKYNEQTTIHENLRNYMLDNFLISPNQDINDTLFLTFISFLEQIDDPKAFITTVWNTYSGSMVERIIGAFMCVDVKKNGGFINSFTQELYDNRA